MQGLMIGIVTFLLIGMFHPLVIKGEYYFGQVGPNILFTIFGFVFIGLSLHSHSFIFSVVLGVVACCCFWSILEMREQEERVLKGWFPENPKRKAYYDSKREAFYTKHPEFRPKGE